MLLQRDGARQKIKKMCSEFWPFGIYNGTLDCYYLAAYIKTKTKNKKNH